MSGGGHCQARSPRGQQDLSIAAIGTGNPAGNRPGGRDELSL
jgi:hypothetical protein